MRLAVVALAALLAAPGLARSEEPGAKPTGPKARVYVVVFDFETTGQAGARSSYGQQLADSVRIRLRRHKQLEIIDRLTTQEFSGPIGLRTAATKVKTLMSDKLGVNVGFYGTVQKAGDVVRAEIACVDLRDPKKPRSWTQVFSNDTQQARGLIAKQVVEAFLRREEWVPPEYGDEPEPKTFGKPVNINGDFEKGHTGWARPDNACEFIEPGPKGRGKVLRIRTDVERDKWLEYRRKLRFGQADPKRPPKLERDTSYASVAGLEGVHYRGQWLDAKAGQRYWLVTDMKGKTAGIFFPKIFVKGFEDWTDRADALPETSLIERKLTPRKFAALPTEKQKALIAEDAKQHPDRYRRECFRWYLACRNEENVWKHYAAPFPPRGGLPKRVRWLQVQVYAYWPPGTYRFDNVWMYKDPTQKTPLDEEKPRTLNFGKTSDVVEKMSKEKRKDKEP